MIKSSNIIKHRIEYSWLFIAPLMLMSGVISAYGETFTISDLQYLPADRTATQNPQKDDNGETCALIKLPFPKVEDGVISGDQIFGKVEYHGNEYWIYMPPHANTFYIKYPGYENLTVDFRKKFPKGVESGKTYKVIIPHEKILPKEQTYSPVFPQNRNTGSASTVVSTQSYSVQQPTLVVKPKDYISPSSFYITAGYQILGVPGLDVGLGGYINNFNIEANFLYGLSKSETIFWNDISGETRPIEATYSPMSFNIMVGYGIKLMNRLRMTPSLGFQYTILNESADTEVANNANTYGMPIGLKIDFAIAKHFGVSVEPSYLIAFGKSEGYKMLADISNKIKNCGDGFGLNVSINFNF